MRHATQEIQKKLSLADRVYQDEDMLDLDSLQQTFAELGRFFENPDKFDFPLSKLRENLTDDWLEFALKVITLYFQKDTYLIREPSSPMMREDGDYLNQSQFAKYLKEQGLNYDRNKLNVYLSRGKLPDPDQVLADHPYWMQSTVNRFAQQEKERVKQKYSSQ